MHQEHPLTLLPLPLEMIVLTLGSLGFTVYFIEDDEPPPRAFFGAALFFDVDLDADDDADEDRLADGANGGFMGSTCIVLSMDAVADPSTLVTLPAAMSVF